MPLNRETEPKLCGKLFSVFAINLKNIKYISYKKKRRKLVFEFYKIKIRCIRKLRHV